MKIKQTIMLLTAINAAYAYADVNYDLDDLQRWEMVSVEICLDAALEKIDGSAQ